MLCRKVSKDFDEKLLKLLVSWNPCSKELVHLKDIIKNIPSDVRIFHIYLIFNCIKSLKNDEEYLTAWEIIDLMNTRVKRTIGSNIKIDYCVFLIKNLEEIALKMPKIDIQINIKMSQKEVNDEISKATKCFYDTVESSSIKIFKIIIRLLERMYQMGDRDIHDVIKFDINIQLILVLFKNYWRKDIIDSLFQ
jgi:hypothetical protein